MPPHRFLTLTLILAAALAAVVSSSRQTSAHQYIVNGSFDDGTAGWSVLSDGSSFDTAQDDVAPVDGSHRARLILGQPNFRVNQSIADVPPGTYRITMSVRVESTNAIVRLDVLTDPAWAKRFSPVSFTATPGEWQHVDAEVVIPGASWVSIRLVGSGIVGDRIYIDNVGFDGAPPATMTPTYTPTPLPATNTPVPPTPTKTPKGTSTASPVATSTEPPGIVDAIATGSLTNGGFEDVIEGLPLAWNKYGGSLSVAASPIRTGSHAARLESTTDSTKWLFQTVAVTGGSSYAFDAWIWHDDPRVASAFLRVSWYASSDGSGEAIGTSDSLSRLDGRAPTWRYLTTSGIAAPAEARTAKLRIMLQPGSPNYAAIYADDAAFGPAEPNATALAEGSSDNPQASADRAEPRAPRGDRLPQLQPLPFSDTASATAARIVINEVFYDSLDTTDAHGEWVELYNAGGNAVDLEGWSIADNKYADRLPAYTLRPGGFVIIVASDSLNSSMTGLGIPTIRITGNIGNSLNNDGDVLVLVNPAGRFADAVSWGDDISAFDPSFGDVPAGHSIERQSPGTDTNSARDFIDNERPSPGHPYTGAAPAPPRAAVTTNTVQILSGESGGSLGWIAWALAAAALGVLAVVAVARLGPVVTQRLRHQ